MTVLRKIYERLFKQIDRRLTLTPLLKTMRETRPAGYISLDQAPPVSPGRITLLLIALLVVSGLVLTLFYVPTAEEAASSLATLHKSQPLGWLVHNIHRWSALLLFVFIILHALRVWLTRAYRYPRDLNWLIGLSVLFLVVILGGTGYLLRWDIKAFALMDLVISNLSGVPIIGPFLVNLILGGSAPDVVPLNRGYALHIWFLPVLLFLAVSVHLLIAWRQGLAHQSIAWKTIAGRVPLNRWAHFLSALVLLSLLLVLSWVTPHSSVAEPDSRSPWPHPDWLLMFYFLPFWFFKGQNRIIGALLIPLALVASLALTPRLLQHLRRPYLLLFLAAAAVVGVFLLFGQMTIMGSQLPMPGCQACHRPGMIGGAPTTLSDFDIRDPDWLVFHLRDPEGSLLVPFSDVP
jgi:quinol-cytochrome oxidoreductase complex cytochrome b subunit